MERLSKEFKQAMRGILKGEKWRQTSWEEGKAYISEVEQHNEILMYYKNYKVYSGWFLDKEGLTAKDWVKVE